MDHTHYDIETIERRNPDGTFRVISSRLIPVTFVSAAEELDGRTRYIYKDGDGTFSTFAPLAPIPDGRP